MLTVRKLVEFLEENGVDKDTITTLAYDKSMDEEVYNIDIWTDEWFDARRYQEVERC